MNFNEYKTLSIRTLAPIEDIYDLNFIISDIAYLNPLFKSSEQAHMALGMISEVNEVWEAINKKDSVNLGEELADIVWYISGQIYLIRGLDSKFELDFEFEVSSHLIFTKNDTKYMRDMTISISELCDLVKKLLAYKKQYNSNHMKVLLYDILKNINYLALSYNIDMNEQLDKNIRKLKKRFSEKFTIEEAIDRNLIDERKELES